MQVVVNSLLINYQKTGKGRLILLLHGWGDSLQTWSRLQKELGTNFCIISLDLPGFGKSQAPLNTWDLEDYTGFIGAFLQKIEARRLFAIVGHSNGGAIAIRGLANGNLEAERLVLLAASGIRTDQKLRKLAFKTIAKAGKAVTWPLPKRARTRARVKLYKAIGSDMLVAENLQETFKKVVSQDVQKDAQKLTLPTLLVYGQGDTDTPALFGMRFHNLIEGSELIVLEQAEHFLHLDQPEAVRRAVEDFLQ